MRSSLVFCTAFLTLTAGSPFPRSHAATPQQNAAQTAAPAPAQTTPAQTTPDKAKPAKRQPPRPLSEVAPGGGPDKVWVNLNTAKYHCFGERYYGRTASGRYMTERAAKSAGAKGPRGRDCPVSK